MSRSRPSSRRPGPAAPVRRSRPLTRVVGLAVATVAVAALGAWWSAGRRDEGAAPAAAAASAAPAPAASAAPAFQKLVGRWVRGDGGYVIEVSGVSDSGRVDAAYFNPRSIRVASARASLEGGGARLVIELRDVNYPGSTYRLGYDAARDVLVGTYFQAVERQMYDVSFMRR